MENASEKNNKPSHLKCSGGFRRSSGTKRGRNISTYTKYIWDSLELKSINWKTMGWKQQNLSVLVHPETLHAKAVPKVKYPYTCSSIRPSFNGVRPKMGCTPTTSNASPFKNWKGSCWFPKALSWPYQYIYIIICTCINPYMEDLQWM